MYNPLYLKLKNFLSHKDTEYNFDEGVVTWITGQILDDSSADSNGSGKSALVDAISLILTGDCIREVSNEDLVMNGEEVAVIEFGMFDPIQDHLVEIVRRIPRVGSSKITVTENGELNTQLKDLKGSESVKYILNLLGLSKEDIQNYFIIGKKYESLFSSTDTAKKAVINRFSKANLIDIADNQVKADIGKQDEIITTLNNTIQRYTGSLETLVEQQQTKYTKKDFEEEKKLAIREHNDTIQQRKQEIASFKTTIENNIKTQGEIRKKIDSLKLTQFDKDIEKLNVKIDENVSSEKELRASLKEVRQLLDEINSSLVGLVNCPKCNHEFNPVDPEIDIVEQREALPETEELKEELLKDVEKLQKEHGDLKQQIRQIDMKIDLLRKDKRGYEDQIATLERANKSENQKILLNEQSIGKLEILIKEQEEAKWVDKSIELKQKIKDIQDRQKEIEEKLQIEQKKRGDLVEVRARYVKFKAYLANKSLSAIECFTNHFLKQMKSVLTMRLDGYKTNKNGTIKEEIVVWCSRDTLHDEKLNKFSEGQKARVEIAGILAMNKIVNEGTNGKGLGLIILDETVSALDSSGIESVLNALSELNQTILFVSHGQYTKSYPHHLNIIYEKGVSRIDE